MQNSTFDPVNIYDYQKTKLNKNAQGVQGVVTAGQVGNLDLTLADDHLVTGGALIVSNAALGDKCHFQVLYNGVVANQYVTDWFMDPSISTQKTPEVLYPAKIVAGLTLRVVYHSTGQNDVTVSMNYDLEKVMK
jgi:hypothetical protein